MGTNYYLYEKEDCEHCGAEAEYKHIGKSSAGWHFSLHVDDEIRNLGDWKDQFFRPNVVIKSEYRQIIDPMEMISIIEDRSSDNSFSNPPCGYESWDKFHAQNHSEEGFCGLLRSQVDGSHCIGHGAGTYDYIAGDFS